MLTTNGLQVIEDINWTLIAEQHGSRSFHQCADRWYNHLAPSMLQRGIWAKGEDRVMLEALRDCGAEDKSDVDWNALVPRRTGPVCKQRWALMARHVPKATMTFPEQVDYLVTKFLAKQKEEDANNIDS